jgi:hypothetical protein
MGILRWIADGLTGIGHAIIAGIGKLFGIKPKPPREKIRAVLRKQWLELASGEKEIPGVEWEGEIYYNTPK